MIVSVPTADAIVALVSFESVTVTVSSSSFKSSCTTVMGTVLVVSPGANVKVSDAAT